MIHFEKKTKDLLQTPLRDGIASQLFKYQIEHRKKQFNERVLHETW